MIRITNTPNDSITAIIDRDFPGHEFTETVGKLDIMGPDDSRIASFLLERFPFLQIETLDDSAYADWARTDQ